MPHTLVRCVAGSYVVGWTDDGRGFAPVGPKFPDPRSAVRYADALEAMPVVHPGVIHEALGLPLGAGGRQSGMTAAPTSTNPRSAVRVPPAERLTPASRSRTSDRLNQTG